MRYFKMLDRKDVVSLPPPYIFALGRDPHNPRHTAGAHAETVLGGELRRRRANGASNSFHLLLRKPNRHRRRILRGSGQEISEMPCTPSRFGLGRSAERQGNRKLCHTSSATSRVSPAG